MAWYDNLLQQGKGLYQQGQNWLTGNNLTSQDPSVRNAMAVDALGTNNQLQDESFSDLSYQDLGGVHPRLGLPIQTRNLNYNIHRDPPRDWREDININYEGAYPQPPFRPNMLDVSGEVGEYGQRPWETGIMRTDQARDKGNFLTNLLKNTTFGKIAAMNNPLNPNAANYNAALAGQIEDLREVDFLGPTSEGYQIQGGPLAGKNLVSLFGTNDYDEMLAKKAAWFQRRKDAGKTFSQKNWDKVIEEQGARAGEITARDTGPVDFDRSGPTQATIRRDRPDKSGRGHRGGFTDPGRGSYGPHMADGGRIGYNRGRVVNPGGYAGEEEFEDENILEFMRDQGVPHSEMAEGPSPFDLRVEELMDEGMSWQEAYNIATKEFGMTTEGQEGSFDDRGIASLV